MLFLIFDDILAKEDSSANYKLDRILDRVADGVHRIDIDNPDALRASSFYQEARPVMRKLLLASVARPQRATIQSLVHSKMVEVRDQATVDVAVRLALAPLIILVEDREADGILLDIVMHYLAPNEVREIWACASTPRAILIETAGGVSAMPERIRRAVADASAEGRPVRLFVLCDSDKRWPGDENSPSAVAIENIKIECERAGIPWHVLEKRSAENYIPDEIFEVMRGDVNNTRIFPVIDALFRRTDVQRDFLPVKDFLQEDEKIKGMACGHFQDNEEKDLSLLGERIFPKRPRPLKNIFDEMFGSFTAEGLKGRDGRDELSRIVMKISREM